MDKELIELFRGVLQEELAPIKVQLDETNRIVKSLEHSAEVNKAEIDAIK